MFELLKIFTKRPTDKTIKLSRIAFGVIFMVAGYYNLIYQGDALNATILWQEISEANALYIKYGIVALGIVPIFMGVTDMCILKSKHMRMLQIAFGIFLFYIAGIIQDSADLEIDTLYGIMGVFPLIAGITGKCITTQGLKCKQKITKIRV